MWLIQHLSQQGFVLPRTPIERLSPRRKTVMLLRTKCWELVVVALTLTACSPTTNYEEFEQQHVKAPSKGEQIEDTAGDKLQPFDAPPLADLEAKAEWVDMPV